MESDTFLTEIVDAHRAIFTNYSSEYEQRTLHAHSSYLEPFLKEFGSLISGRQVIDLGCGPGRDLEWFSKHNFDAIGIDISPAMVARCHVRNQNARCDDFLISNWYKEQFDGVWAYTSLTLIPKSAFIVLLDKIYHSLRVSSGYFALGMIVGEGEGWKSDNKYDGKMRYVARYRKQELLDLLSAKFGTVRIDEVTLPSDPSKTYLHAICRAIEPVNSITAAKCARDLFDQYADDYELRTTTGASLLEPDRRYFSSLIGAHSRILDCGSGPGRDAFALQGEGHDVVCLDISSVNIRKCAEKGLSGFVGQIQDIDRIFGPDAFDGVWSNCALTNWIPPDTLGRAAKGIARIVKPNGAIFLGSVIGSFRGIEIDGKYGGLPRYNNHWEQSELEQWASSIGQIIYRRDIPSQMSGRKHYLNLICQKSG